MVAALIQTAPARAINGTKAQSNRNDDVNSFVNNSASGVQVGRFVTRVTSAEQTAAVIANAADCAPRKIAGLVLRDAAQELSATEVVPQYETMPVAREGYFYAICESAYTIGDPLFVRHTIAGAEVAGALRNAQDSTDCVKIPGVFLSTGDAGTIALFYMNLDAADADTFGGAGMPAGGTAGDILVYTAAGWTRLAAGTEGQVLKIVSGVPAWAADAT